MSAGDVMMGKGDPTFSRSFSAIPLNPSSATCGKRSRRTPSPVIRLGMVSDTVLNERMREHDRKYGLEEDEENLTAVLMETRKEAARERARQHRARFTQYRRGKQLADVSWTWKRFEERMEQVISPENSSPDACSSFGDPCDISDRDAVNAAEELLAFAATQPCDNQSDPQNIDVSTVLDSIDLDSLDLDKLLDPQRSE